MHPELFSIGPLTITTYGLFMAMGCATALFVTIKIGKTRGFESSKIMDMGFIIILCAIIGSRLGYVFLNLSHYIHYPLDIFKTWDATNGFDNTLLTQSAEYKHLPISDANRCRSRTTVDHGVVIYFAHHDAVLRVNL